MQKKNENNTQSAPKIPGLANLGQKPTVTPIVAAKPAEPINQKNDDKIEDDIEDDIGDDIGDDGGNYSDDFGE